MTEQRRVLYVSPLEYGHNPTVDAVAHGLHRRLAANGVELGVVFADFRADDWPANVNQALLAGVSSGVDAIAAWLVTPEEPREGVEAARANGIPVVTVERPRFHVDASVVWPNFNHGVYMAQHLADLLDPGARVAIIGGPEAVDDVELVHGLVHGVRSAGLQLVNDPWLPRYRNSSDVTTGGFDAASAVLEDFTELDALIPFNDETMLGTLRALRTRGRLGEPRMVSRNGTPAAVEAVREGLTDGCWDIEPITIGTMLADLLSRAVSGERLGGLCVASPIGRMVTQESAADWMARNDRSGFAPLPPSL